jgi:predicted RNA binding protein YcfA (HicA-like mRNA interferase family)
MSSWPSAKARHVLAALKRIGWRHDRTVGSHKIMKKGGWAD